MRSLGTSVYLLTVAVGTYMASALNIIVAAGVFLRRAVSVL